MDRHRGLVGDGPLDVVVEAVIAKTARVIASVFSMDAQVNDTFGNASRRSLAKSGAQGG